MDKIAQRVVVTSGMKCEQVWQKGKNPQAAKAHSLICYRAVRELGISATALAGRIATSKPAIRQSEKGVNPLPKKMDLTDEILETYNLMGVPLFLTKKMDLTDEILETYNFMGVPLFLKQRRSITPMQQITLGLSVHRPEMIPLISDLMQRHYAIFLEEPPTADFRQMLQGVVSVDDYLGPLDVEYPEFSRRMCCLLRKLHAKGKTIFQVEPFMESLLAIHEFFADGHGPGELNKNSLQYPVYLAERNATAALLAYYRTVMHESFDKTIGAIKQFARMDAARFRLRDSLRAQELASLIGKYSSSYVEAGVIHYPLWRLLRQQVPSQIRVRPLFLANVALKAMKEKGHLYGPGDQLTLLYMFHPTITNTMREQVLAARSIIYSKIIVKEELTEEAGTFPHVRDELACIRATGQLTLDDCRRLFPLVRRAKSLDTRQIVAEYLTESKPQTQN